MLRACIRTDTFVSRPPQTFDCTAEHRRLLERRPHKLIFQRLSEGAERLNLRQVSACQAMRESVDLQHESPAGPRSGNVRKVLAACAAIAAGLLSPSKSSAAGIVDYLTKPLYEPIRGDVPYGLRSLVWNDFRLAVLIFVATPLVIWLWSLIEQKGPQDAVKRMMFGYWQAASLLMFTVYLQIGAQPISFATAAAVQVIIPFTLWWWKDLSLEVSQQQSSLARVFKFWRIVATVLAVLGAATQILTTQAACTLLPDPTAILNTPGCAAWLEPPMGFKAIFHPNIAADKLQIFGQVGALFYAANFLLYLAVSLPRAGRIARSNKSISYQVLAKLGFYSS